MLDNLQRENKEIIGFKEFDKDSKKLCASFHQIDKNIEQRSKKILSSEFIRFCDQSNVKDVSVSIANLCHRPLFGRNEIAKYFFQRLSGSLDER